MFAWLFARNFCFEPFEKTFAVQFVQDAFIDKAALKRRRFDRTEDDAQKQSRYSGHSEHNRFIGRRLKLCQITMRKLRSSTCKERVSRDRLVFGAYDDIARIELHFFIRSSALGDLRESLVQSRSRDAEMDGLGAAFNCFTDQHCADQVIKIFILLHPCDI